MTHATARAGLGAGALVAVAAVAIAGLLVVPDSGQWAAHAQSDPVTIKVGSLMANVTNSSFNDVYRAAVVDYAVKQFNTLNTNMQLELSVTSYKRDGNASDPEPAKLIEAYNNSDGPRFYVGPTTSQGLVNMPG